MEFQGVEPKPTVEATPPPSRSDTPGRGQAVDAADESVQESATSQMQTDVVFTLRESVDHTNGNVAVPVSTSMSEETVGYHSPAAAQRSTDSAKKNTLSTLFGRLRGVPGPVKSAASPSSTTGLIFENRPSNLPAKPTIEEKKHRKEYEAMLEAAEQKKRKQEGLLRREATDRIKREEEESSRLAFWLKEVLPHWETLHVTRKTRDLWWCGLPTRVRGQVWRRALGNDLQITQDLYEISKSRAAEMLKLGIKTKDDTSDTTSSDSGAERWPPS